MDPLTAASIPNAPSPLLKTEQQDTLMADAAPSPTPHQPSPLPASATPYPPLLPQTQQAPQAPQTALPPLAPRTSTPVRTTNGTAVPVPEPMPAKAAPHGAPARRYLNERVTGVLLEGMKRLASEQ
ncbi:COMPASS (complex proteins associated with Set1p) component [Xylographa trunciseda]|nr:COMPASS (complex proteins associated with Set1p) component [Xylographa trunciseda]